ncbi:N-acyl homoserine lactonase family protein [Agromyces sp. Soil535]|uniref:N-acyl homoserine lactonase family protein n=1 Tax=Agromyces sp. Soil535 TaxID=1736390 RepID=UPI000AD123DA|nr:N-acyl homoserine lactonase family protein [Agromyces sp. Soil535]
MIHARPARFDGTLPVGGSPVRLVPLVLGWEPIRESVSIRGGDPRRYLLEPVTAAAVEYADGWVLLDSGFDVDIIRDPERRAAHYNYDGYTALVPPGDPLVEQIAAAGLDWGALRGIAISHLHVDHTGGLRLIGDDVPLLLQAAEWDWLESGAGLREVVFPEGALARRDQVRLLQGDAVIAAGLEALDTAGHTPGHQSFRVTLPERTIVLACDAADLRANIEGRLPCGWTGSPGGDAAAQRAIDRLADLDAAGEEVWPGHDPEWHGWLQG